MHIDSLHIGGAPRGTATTTPRRKAGPGEGLSWGGGTVAVTSGGFAMQLGAVRRSEPVIGWFGQTCFQLLRSPTLGGNPKPSGTTPAAAPNGENTDGSGVETGISPLALVSVYASVVEDAVGLRWGCDPGKVQQGSRQLGGSLEDGALGSPALPSAPSIFQRAVQIGLKLLEASQYETLRVSSCISAT